MTEYGLDSFVINRKQKVSGCAVTVLSDASFQSIFSGQTNLHFSQEKSNHSFSVVFPVFRLRCRWFASRDRQGQIRLYRIRDIQNFLIKSGQWLSYKIWRLFSDNRKSRAIFRKPAVGELQVPEDFYQKKYDRSDPYIRSVCCFSESRKRPGLINPVGWDFNLQNGS